MVHYSRALVPPSGKEIVFSGFSLYHFVDDQITEIWEGYNRFTLLQRLGRTFHHLDRSVIS